MLLSPDNSIGDALVCHSDMRTHVVTIDHLNMDEAEDCLLGICKQKESAGSHEEREKIAKELAPVIDNRLWDLEHLANTFNVVLKKLLTNKGAYLTEFLEFYQNEDQSKTHAQSHNKSCNRIVKCEEILSCVFYVHPRELTATVWNSFMRKALKGHLK